MSYLNFMHRRMVVPLEFCNCVMKALFCFSGSESLKAKLAARDASATASKYRMELLATTSSCSIDAFLATLVRTSYGEAKGLCCQRCCAAAASAAPTAPKSTTSGATGRKSLSFSSTTHTVCVSLSKRLLFFRKTHFFIDGKMGRRKGKLVCRLECNWISKYCILDTNVSLYNEWNRGILRALNNLIKFSSEFDS